MANEEIEYAANRIANAARIKKVLLPEEVKEMTKHLSMMQRRKVIRKLRELKFDLRENMVKFNDNVVSDEEITDNQIFSFLVRPEFVNSTSDVIQVGSNYYRGIAAAGFPAQVKENWLGKLTQESSDIDFSMFIEPGSVRALEVYLSGQLKKVENDLYKYQSKGISNPSLESRKKELVEQLNNLVQGNYKMFKMTLYMAAKGVSAEKAKALGSRIMSSLHSEGIEAKNTLNYNEQLLKSIIPTGVNHLKGRQIFVPGPAAAASFPFSSPFYEVDEKEGVLLGFNENNIPVGMSLWKLPKYVGAVIGASGSGKSYASKAFLLNERMVNGTKVFILDPEDEYTEMCSRIENSQVVSLNRDSKNIPNILSLMGGGLPDKLVALPKIFDVLLGGLTENQKPMIEEALIGVYKKKGIVEAKPKSWKKTPPTLSDLLNVLTGLKKKNPSLKNDYDVIIGRLMRYTKGVFKFMNRKGDGINIKKDFIVFEFKSMPEEVRAVLMLILLEFIKTRFLKDKEKKLLVMDEAWRILKNKTEADYIENFARTFRKSNGGLLLITQSIAEMQDSQEGKAYLANTSFQYILRTERVLAQETCKLFGLNNTEKDLIVNAKPGEAILVWGGKHHRLNIKVDPKTHELITTNPEEVKGKT